MAEVASAVCLRKVSQEHMDLIEFLQGIEEDNSELEHAAEQIEIEDESPKSRSLETMMTYFMVLEEELTIEKQKVQRLQKKIQEIEKDRLEIDKHNQELIKQKHMLETENHQLRQRLWKVKDLFTKSTDELWQLRRQNRMLHGIIQMNKSHSLDRKKGSNNSQKLRRSETLDKQSHQNIPQQWSNITKDGLNACVSEPNMQHSSLQYLPHDNDDSIVCNSSLLRDFITLKQAQQKESNAGDVNTMLLEGVLQQPKCEAEELSVKEGSIKPDDSEATGFDAGGCSDEEIPIMPAPLPKDLLILFDDGTEIQVKNEQSEDKNIDDGTEIQVKNEQSEDKNIDDGTEVHVKNEQSEDKNINKLEERNNNLTKALQKLEMEHTELKYNHNCLSRIVKNIRRQGPVDQSHTESPKRKVFTRKVRSGCFAKGEALLNAVKSGSAIAVRQAILEGEDVNLNLLGKWTALHLAAGLGYTDICEVLIDAGALKHARDRWGDTPLHWAAVTGHKEVASLLVHRGADVSRQGKEGKKPREKALVAGHDDLASWFAKKEQEK